MTRLLTYQPSILLGVGISRRGGVHYERQPLDVEVKGETETKRWETTRQVVNLAELEKAEQAVGEYRRLLHKVCIRTGFGILCPKSKEGLLDAAIAEIRDKAGTVNDELTTCRIHVAFVKGQIASADKEAAAAISDVEDYTITCRGPAAYALAHRDETVLCESLDAAKLTAEMTRIFDGQEA